MEPERPEQTETKQIEGGTSSAGTGSLIERVREEGAALKQRAVEEAQMIRRDDLDRQP